MLAADEVADNIEARLRLQMAVLPIIDLRTAKTYIESLRQAVDRQLAIKGMNKSDLKSRLSDKTLTRLFAALCEAGIMRLVAPTPENMDTTKDSELMRCALEAGILKPMFGGSFQR